MHCCGTPWRTRPITERRSAISWRLKRETIDLYQMHEWDGETPIEEAIDALDALQRSGKVRYIGCSNYSGWHIMKAQGAVAGPDAPSLKLRGTGRDLI